MIFYNSLQKLKRNNIRRHIGQANFIFFEERSSFWYFNYFIVSEFLKLPFNFSLILYVEATIQMINSNDPNDQHHKILPNNKSNRNFAPLKSCLLRGDNIDVQLY